MQPLHCIDIINDERSIAVYSAVEILRIQWRHAMRHCGMVLGWGCCSWLRDTGCLWAIASPKATSTANFLENTAKHVGVPLVTGSRSSTFMCRSAVYVCCSLSASFPDESVRLYRHLSPKVTRPYTLDLLTHDNAKSPRPQAHSF